MKQNQTLCFLQSLIFLPFMTLSFNVNADNITKSIPVIPWKVNQIDKQLALKMERTKKIDYYFSSRNLPLAGHGLKMVEVAEEYGLDWRIIPAIAMRESTAGKFACKNVPNNPFGWGSCEIGFDSIDQAIETIGHNLSGKNPVTAEYYSGDLESILDNYNGLVVLEYAEQVMSIMDAISNEKDLA